MIESPDNKSRHSVLAPDELRVGALYWLSESDPAKKVQGVTDLMDAWQSGTLKLAEDTVLVSQEPIPGRPVKPDLVPPLGVKHRSMHTVEGRAVLIHALAHIEFNAINLALDAIWRFHGMPREFYADWLKVAAEEAFHFSLLSGHLREQGFSYGEFPAHNSLWDMAEKTQGDILGRIALVPRTMEARGLDAVPSIRAKLAQAGDAKAADILDIILRDEIGHVAIGNHWYGWLCTQRNLEPINTYSALAQQYKAPSLRGPFNLPARKAAGFSDGELALLMAGNK